MEPAPPAASESTSHRLVALDGLRGWASLSVLFYHLTWETFGHLLPGFRSLPVAILGDGTLAVGLFLMVSGYVLTARGWRNPDKHPIRRSLLKRYFRLTIPIIAATVLYWAVIALGWVQSGPAAAIVQSPDWLGSFAHETPNLVNALLFGAFGTYWAPSTGGYGPFLWTMAIELWGSYVILGICLFELPRYAAYVPLALVTAGAFLMPVNPYFPIVACYPAGAIVALLVKDGIIGAGASKGAGSVFATTFAVLLLLAAAVSQIVRPPYWVTPVLTMALFVATLRSRSISMFLSLPLSHWLGRISFPLYLLQISVIASLTSGLIVLANGTVGLGDATAAAIVAASMAVTLLLAWLFLPIERLALRVSGAIGQLWRPKLLAPTRDGA